MSRISPKLRAKKTVIRVFLLSVVGLCIVFHSNVAGSQQTDRDRETFRRRKIKTITSWVYKYQSGVPNTSGIKQFSRSYDQRGNMTDFIAFDSSRGEALQTESYKYDAENKLIGSAFGDALHWNDGYRTYTYNGHGQLIESELRKPDRTLKTRYTYKYDAKGKLIENVFYTATGEIASTRSYQYDASGKLVEFSSVRADGGLDEKSRHQYNDQGNAILSITYDSAGRVSSRTNYKYADQQYLVQKMVYLPDGSLSIGYTYRYDKNGDQVEEIELNSKGEPAQLTKLDYEFYP